MADERRFTEEEVTAILGRAVDLERKGVSNPAVAGSLTLTELKEVAAEAGIGAALVETAAREIVLDGPSGPMPWLGPPARNRVSRLLDTDLSEEDVELLMRLVEKRTNQHGLLTEALGRVTWTAETGKLTTAVSVSKQQGKARIDVDGRYPERIRPLLHLIPGALALTTVLSIAATAGLSAAPIMAVAGGAVGVGVGRGLWEIISRTTAKKVEALADEVASSAVDLGSKERQESPAE